MVGACVPVLGALMKVDDSDHGSRATRDSQYFLMISEVQELIRWCILKK